VADEDKIILKANPKFCYLGNYTMSNEFVTEFTSNDLSAISCIEKLCLKMSGFPVINSVKIL
jgi:hypothetical protein